MLMSLAQAHALLPGSRLVGAGATAIQRVHSDSRSLRDGDLFVALRGERFDAHDFLPQARAAGARAALAERGLAEAGLPGLLVPDTLLALQQLARAWRAQLTLPVIVVAGSNGKTTVTQMIAAILHAWLGDAALATAGNFNNHIGVPLQVLRLTPEHRVAVFELGMNHPGEIATLARIAQATVGIRLLLLHPLHQRVLQNRRDAVEVDLRFTRPDLLHHGVGTFSLRPLLPRFDEAASEFFQLPAGAGKRHAFHVDDSFTVAEVLQRLFRYVHLRLQFAHALAKPFGGLLRHRHASIEVALDIGLGKHVRHLRREILVVRAEADLRELAVAHHLHREVALEYPNDTSLGGFLRN